MSNLSRGVTSKQLSRIASPPSSSSPLSPSSCSCSSNSSSSISSSSSNSSSASSSSATAAAAATQMPQTQTRVIVDVSTCLRQALLAAPCTLYSCTTDYCNAVLYTPLYRPKSIEFPQLSKGFHMAGVMITKRAKAAILSS